MGLGPHENYPDRKSSACFSRWRLPLSEMSTPYIFPSENGLRCDCKALDWGYWHVAGQFHFSVQPYSTEQLMTTDHWHRMTPEKGVWITLDGQHMGVGGDDSGHQAFCHSGCCSKPTGTIRLRFIVNNNGGLGPHRTGIIRYETL